jgi:hypothetical protein
MVHLPRTIYFKETPLDADLFLASCRTAAMHIRHGGPPLDEPPRRYPF